MAIEETSAEDRTTPLDIKLKRDEGQLIVTWKDRHESTYELAYLRKRCPCATCNADRQKQAESTELFPILQKDPGTGPPRAQGAQLVGNYAVQIMWADGHHSGIYDFRLLRSLDEKTSI